MSRNIGQVQVSILPDGSRFKIDAEAALKKASAGLAANVKLNLSDDLKAKLEAAAKAASGVKASVKVDANTKDFDAKLAALAARSEALKKSLGNIKISDPNMQAFLKGITKQVDDLRNSLDHIDAGGLDKADASLNRMIGSSDKVRAALGKTTFAEDEMARAAKDAADKAAQGAAKQSAALTKATAAAKHFADTVGKSGINDNVVIKTRLDNTLSDVQAQELRIKLDHIKGTAKVDVDDKDAVGKVVAIRELFKRLLGKITVPVKIDAKSATNTMSLLGLKFKKDAAKAGGDAGNALGNSFGSGALKSMFTQRGAIIAAVVAGFAALPAAVGAIGVISGIALGAGIIFAAEKLITSQLKNIQSISKAQLAVNTDQATISRLSNTKKLTAAQQQQLAVAKQKLGVDQQTLALAKNNSAGISQKQLLAYQASFNNLNNAIARAKASFLIFALVASKPLLKPFTDAVDYLSKQLRGPLAVAFRNLFTAVGPLVKPVVQSLLEIVKGILPGMTTMLNKARGPLTTMFIGFGKIVGLHLGQWFKDAIPYMQASVKYFLGLINALGIAGSYLIKFGGESAKAFGNPALKGFGPLIQKIANDLIKMVKPAFDGWISVMAPVAKSLLKIITPLLDFLANNPRLVKALAQLAAAFYLSRKAVDVANIGLKLFKIEAMTGPWTIVIAGFAIAAIEIIKHWNTITAFFKKWWPWIVGFATGTLGILVVVIIKHWAQIANVTAGIWGHVFGVLKNYWGDIESVTVGATKAVANWVTTGWSKVYTNTVNYWHNTLNFFIQIWGHIENVVTGATKTIANWVTTAWSKIYTNTVNYYNNTFNFFKQIWGHIENVFTDATKNIKNWIGNAWNWVKSNTQSAYNTVYTYIIGPLQKAWNWVSNTFTRGVKSAFSGLLGAVKSIWNGLKHAVGDPVNFVIGLWNKFAGFVNKGLGIFHIKLSLPTIPTLKFARGGHVPGYAPGQDTVPAMLSPGEYVINPVAAKKIGKTRLDALNSLTHGPAGPNKRGHFANGGEVLADAEKWKGHPYRWGGGSNPRTGWDCSSFVNYIVGHDYNLNLPGGGSWAQETANGAAHGPVAAQYNNWTYGRRVPWTDAKRADLAVENNGGHITFVAQDNVGHGGSTTLQAFGAVDTAMGTTFQQISPNDFHLVRFADDRGLLAQAAGALGSVLKPLAQAALNGIGGIVNLGLNHIPFPENPITDMAKQSVYQVIEGAKNALNNNPDNWQFLGPSSFGPDGQGTSAGEMANGLQLYRYLLNNLFNGNKIAAAGATASIWGESAWNPFAQGTGGRGLIGWTPPSTISDAAFKGGMATQLPAIIQFVSRSGDQGAIAEMETASSVLGAANIWGKKVERYGINDVHATGLALATQFMNTGGGANTKAQQTVLAHATTPIGGTGSLHFASGGSVPNLSAAQKAELSAYGTLRSKTEAALARPNAYVKSHASTLKSELATLATRQAKEEAAYAKLSGSGMTASNFSKFLTSTHSVLSSTKDKALSHAEVKPSGALGSAITDLDKLKFEVAVAKSKTPAKPKAPDPKLVAAYDKLTVTAAAAQAAEQSAFANLPTAKMGALSGKQKAEVAAYWKYINAGLLKGNPAQLAADARGMLNPVHDTALDKALNVLSGLSPAAVSRAASGKGSSAHKLIGQFSPSSYLADLKEVRGLPLSKIRDSAELKHVWHLLHLQHLADVKKFAHGGEVPTHVFDRGGTLAPGVNTVYNLTGKPEHLRPVNGSSDVNVTLDIQGGDSETEQFLLQILRKVVRVRGGGNVQRALGRH